MASNSQESSDEGTGSSGALRLVTPSAQGGTARGDTGEQTTDSGKGDFNIRILNPMFRYMRAKFGAEVLDDVVRDCGIAPETIRRNNEWIRHEQLERLLSAAREMTGSDEEFMRACTFELKKQYGAFILIVRGMSVGMTFRMMARTSPMVCRASYFEVVDGGRTSVRVRYVTQHNESRLSCLSRQAQLKMGPTLFMGMAPARLSEHSCVAHGDDCCEYELSWYEPLRTRRVIAGLALGVGAAAAMPASWAAPGLAFTVLPLLGGIIGASIELRRLIDEHLKFSDTTAREMEQIVGLHTQAMDELTALQERERNWSRLLEQAVSDRTLKLNTIVRRLKSVLRRRTGEFPALPSDLQQPLDALTSLADDLPEDESNQHVAAQSPVNESAVDRVSKLVGELVDIAEHDPVRNQDGPEEVMVDELVARIRRHLKATMIGRDVRITVFQTREAPERIVTVRTMLERIIDNLLFNASRHTERGSIVVEVGGTPGSLLLKLSDTGEGVATERLEQVFGNDMASASLPAHNSGLSSAAGLLDRLGGRLEVMSEPKVGTTLWVYFPLDIRSDEQGDRARSKGQTEQESDEARSEMVGRVVTIRAHSGSGSHDAAD